MQKYAILEKETNMLLAWYSEEIQGILVPEKKDDGGKVIKEKYYDISNFPKPYIKVDDTTYNEALSKGLNYYNSKTKKFEVKDFSTLAEKINLALSVLKRNTNYESPTVCLEIAWVGGYESAQMLNAKRTLCLEMGLESCTFTDNDDTDHVLTLEQAKEVCIAVAAEFETRRADYKAKKRAIELCTTMEELEAIEI